MSFKIIRFSNGLSQTSRSVKPLPPRPQRPPRPPRPNRPPVKPQKPSKPQVPVSVSLVPSVLSNRKALLMGLNYTGTSSALNGCENDVENIRDFLIKDCGFLPSEIKVMTEDSVPNQRPTRANIISAINELVKDNNENSRLFFHYSGHGSHQRDSGTDEADQQDESICPLDYSKAGMIIDDDLKKLLVNPLKAGARLTAIFDSCHSGSVLDLKHEYSIDLTNSNSSSYTTKVNEKVNEVSGAYAVMISGSRDSEYSSDIWFNGSYQGALTSTFLETVRKIKSEKKDLSYKLLMKDLTNTLKARNHSQRPQFSSNSLVELNSIIAIP